MDRHPLKDCLFKRAICFQLNCNIFTSLSPFDANTLAAMVCSTWAICSCFAEFSTWWTLLRINWLSKCCCSCAAACTCFSNNDFRWCKFSKSLAAYFQFTNKNKMKKKTHTPDYLLSISDLILRIWYFFKFVFQQSNFRMQIISKVNRCLTLTLHQKKLEREIALNLPDTTTVTIERLVEFGWNTSFGCRRKLLATNDLLRILNEELNKDHSKRLSLS